MKNTHFTKRLVLTAASVLLAVGVSPAAQRPQFSDTVRGFVTIDAPVVALTNVRVIDGTGGPAKANQTLILREGSIAEMGDAARIKTPEGATVVDLTGKSVIPGLVMVHEHLYYPTGPGVYAQLGQSFIRLYLAGGVTTMRTGGNVNGFMDFSLKRLVDAGQHAGPAIDATAPYLNGPNQFLQMRALTDADDARRQVAYWADMGATSFKAYMNITRAALGASVEEAHKRGLKITGHLCSVTYSEAADLGIDNLEHGFLASTDFVSDKEPDSCPGQGRGQQALATVDLNGEPFKALVKKLVDKKVALTSTLTVFETYTPGRPMPPGLAVLVPQLREQFEQGLCSHGQERTIELHQAVSAGDVHGTGVRQGGRPAHRWHRSHRRRRSGAGLFESTSDRASRGSRVLATRGDLHRDAQRRQISRTRGAHWLDSRGQAGRSRRDQRRPVDDDRRRQDASRRCSSRASATTARS